MTETQNFEMHYVPSLRERVWRRIGFRFHLGAEPPGVEVWPGWARTELRMSFGVLDRIRLLLTGRLHISLTTYADTPINNCRSRTDWIIDAPGMQS